MSRIVLACLFLVASCGKTARAPAPLRVVHGAEETRGLGTEARPIPLYLNSNVTVSFSADLDKLSVTTHTVRMFKLTGHDRGPVKMARTQVRTRSVILEPIWPVHPKLDDGSYQADQLYRLEVAGYPATDTVEAMTRVRLGRMFVRYYRTVKLEARDPGPLLPSGLLSEPFEVATRSLRMASDRRTIRLHFTLPVDPRTVSAESFSFLTTEDPRGVPIESVRVLTVRQPLFDSLSYPSSTIELRFASGHEFKTHQRFWINLRPEGPKNQRDPKKWIRDYRGQHVTAKRAVLTGIISKGKHVELIRFDASGVRLGSKPPQPLRLEPGAGGTLSFEPRPREKRIQVLVRKDVGQGKLGEFAPKQSMVLALGVAFDGGDGQLKRPPAGSLGRFEFTSIWIRKGVTVTIRSRLTHVELLATNDIRIDGELVLETPRASPPPALPHMKEPAVRDLPDDARRRYFAKVIHQQFGCRLVAAGDILVRGRIRHHLNGDSPPPLVLLGRRLGIWAPIPDGTVLALEEAVEGTVQGVHQVPNQREPGFSGPMMQAVARTPWVQIPADYDGSTFDARVEDLRGDLEVSIQVAPPDSIDPKSPYRDPARLARPLRLPLRQPVDAGDPRRRNFIRFILRAKVREGHALPSLEALVILGD